MEKAGFVTRSSVNWRSAITDFVLAGMVVGPLLAPFLSTSKLPLSGIAEIIYAMGSHVCPQPDMGLVLAPPFTMAVCMRCYGTVIGLLFTRLLYAISSGTGFYWLTQYGLGGAILTSLLMTAYPAELAAQVLSLWSFNNFVVTLFGLITGVGAGLYFMPILKSNPEHP